MIRNFAHTGGGDSLSHEVVGVVCKMFQSTSVFSQGVETFHHWFFAQVLLLHVPTLRLSLSAINQMIVGSYSQVLLLRIPIFFVYQIPQKPLKIADQTLKSPSRR